MPFLTVYQVSADPLFNSDVSITNEFQVEITDNDDILEDPDSDGIQQFDTSSIPGLSNSQNFQIFENYSATVDGSPVTYILLQFTGGAQYIVVTSGTVNVNDELEGNVRTQFRAPEPEYEDLPSFVCFTAGSRILTPSGLRLIETLTPGDAVVVGNGSTRLVRWVGRRSLSRQELRDRPKLCPIRIRAGSFGPQTPTRDVLVSPQHRIAVSSPSLQLLCCDPMMLAPAKTLVNGRSITQQSPDRGVEYIHILFDAHELVNVDGLWSESFFPGDCTMNAMSIAARDELLTLVPDLYAGNSNFAETALPVLKPFEVELFKSDLSAPNGTKPAMTH
ncbi:MAG: Hint domain-containing protein [Ruegeria sp.]